jgi:hypothetical protein
MKSSYETISYDRLIKNLIRTALFRLAKRVSKCALLMPSIEMLDIKELLKKRVLNRKTFIFIIEKNRYIADSLEYQLEGLFDNKPHIHRGTLESFDFRVIQEKAGAGAKLDFVYLDTCGNLLQDLYPLIYNLPKFCTANAFLAFTFATVHRSTAKFFRSNWRYIFDCNMIEDKATRDEVEEWKDRGGDTYNFSLLNDYRYDRLHDLDEDAIELIPALENQDPKPAVFDKSILVAAIIEELTGGTTDQRYLYIDNVGGGKKTWMTTLSITLGGKRNANFLKWSKLSMAGFKAGQARKQNAKKNAN